MTRKIQSTKQEFTKKLDILQKEAHKTYEIETVDVHQLMEKMVETFPDQLYKTIEWANKECPDSNRDFFITTILWNDPFNPKLFKRQWFWSFECPRPYLNFTVFKYHRKSDHIEMIWSIPDRETLNFYYKNRIHASPEDWVILKDVIEYKDGSLYKKMQELNKETPDKPSLIVHDKTIFH